MFAAMLNQYGCYQVVTTTNGASAVAVLAAVSPPEARRHRLSGVQIILGSGVDTRKTLVVGIAFIFGLSLDIVPGLYGSIFSWLQPLFDSSLTLAAIVAILLNLLLCTRQAPLPPLTAEEPHRILWEEFLHGRHDRACHPLCRQGYSRGALLAILWHNSVCTAWGIAFGS